MKKFMSAIIVIYSSMIVVGYAQMIVPSSENYIFNENDQQVINTEGIQDPLRDGAYQMIDPSTWTGQLEGVVGVGDKISTHETAKNKTIQVIKNIINYALWLLALIALVYLIYHGFLVLTAAGNDAQYKKWLGGIKYAIIAIVGIGASRLIVSLIFWLLNIIILPNSI